MEEIRDLRNIPIETGDLIAYPCRQGSSCWMSIGVVKEFKVIRNCWNKEKTVIKLQGIKISNNWWTHDKLVTIYRTDRVIIVQKNYEESRSEYLRDLPKKEYEMGDFDITSDLVPIVKLEPKDVCQCCGKRVKTERCGYLWVCRNCM